jgi:CheY-like chemotaxis protein
MIKAFAMIVEDQQDQAFFLSEILQANGYRVVWAKNGREALRLILQGPVPDILLTDIEMPVLDGFQLIKELKKRHIEVPTVIASAAEDDAYFEKAFMRGVGSYLVKPISPSHLLSRLDEVLKKTA